MVYLVLLIIIIPILHTYTTVSAYVDFRLSSANVVFHSLGSFIRNAAI